MASNRSMSSRNRFHSLCFLTVLFLFTSILSADVLIIQPRPDFAGSEWVVSGGRHFLFSEVEELALTGNYDTVQNLGHAQERDFIFLRPKQSVQIEIDIPANGVYYIWTRTFQHGNSTPKANVTIDGGNPTEIEGRGWLKVEAGNLNRGKHIIRYQENNSGNCEWPYCLFPIDIIAVTNDPQYKPSDHMTRNPYNEQDSHWFPRPAEDMSGIEIQSGSQKIVVQARNTWGPYDLVAVSDRGQVQATQQFTQSGFSGVRFDVRSAKITPGGDSTRTKIMQGELVPVDNRAITPNNDMVEDTVSLDPSGLPGPMEVTNFEGENVFKSSASMETWNGRNSEGKQAEKGSYILQNRGRIAVVKCDPTVPALLKPRVSAFSPNGDGVYDTIQVHLAFAVDAGDTVRVKEARTDQVVLDKLPIEKNQHWQIEWDGTNNRGTRSTAGTYIIEVRDAQGKLRAGPKIDLLDRPATPTGPWETDYFPLAIWALNTRPIQDTIRNAKEHFCNGLYSSRGPDVSVCDIAQRHGVKVMCSLMGMVEGNILHADVAPSELELEAMFQPFVSKLKNHPGHMGYYLADEPTYNEEKAYRLYAVQQVLRQMDPEHPATICNIAGDNRGHRYVRELKPNLMLIDVYPKVNNAADEPGNLRHMFHNNAPYGTMVEYMDGYMDIAETYGGEPWMILQAHSHMDQLAEPTPIECRNQIWLSLTQGNQGIFFFAYETQQTWNGLVGPAPEYRDSRRWMAIAQTYRRLQPLLPTLVKLDRAKPAATVTGGGNPYGYENGEVGTLTDGKTDYLVVVNRNCTRPDRITVQSDRYPNARLKDLETGRVYEVGRAIPFQAGDGKLLEIMP